MTTIYLLIDPNTGQWRYIGATKQPQTRFIQHQRGRGGTTVEPWEKKLQARGQEPIVKILAEVPDQDASAVERAWITKALDEGHPLLNINQHELMKRQVTHLRSQGYSYAKIGEICAISRQRAHQIDKMRGPSHEHETEADHRL